MKISAKTDYACIAMLELAASYESGETVRIADIAERNRIPARFLVQILLQLKGAGLVDSVRGAAGGYRLLRAPDDISVGDVIRAMDGRDRRLIGGRGETAAQRAVHQVWAEAAQAEQELLDRISFAELQERARRQSEPMYYI